VAVDAARNEVVLLDANRFDILVYDRLANAPLTGALTQPKRRIGGVKTQSQFASTMFIDPTNGDIYAVNNDSLIGLNVFSRRAVGDVAPDRHFDAPYGSFGLAVDETKQELFLTIQHDSAVGVWPKSAAGEAQPIRSLQGDRTRLADPHAIAFDLENRLMFVTNFGTSRLAVPGTAGRRGAPRIAHWPAGTQFYRDEVVVGSGRFGLPSVTVFPMDARGNVAPLRVIQGPKTQLSWPTGISVDAEHGELFVANDTGDAITVYSTTANGDVAPIRSLKGPKTSIKNPLGVFVDVASDELWVANYGNHTATVYRRTASGDSPPLRVIRSAPADAPATMISNPYSIAYDPTREEILVPSCVQHPRIAAFPRLADKNAAATRMIQGQKTLLNRTVHGIAYDQLHDEIIVNSNIGQAVLTYRGGADGDEAPIRIIQGPRTLLRDPVSVALDAVHDEVFVFQRGPASEMVLVFDRTARGDVAPKRVLNASAGHGAVDPVHNLLVLPGEGGFLIFDRTAEGRAQPKAKITGPNSGARGARAIVVYPSTGKIVANISAGGEDAMGGYVGVWSLHASGDVPPEWTIGKGILEQVRGLTLDPANKSVLVSDKYYNGVLTFALPEMFDAASAQRTARVSP
jgi:DNA-binding beta-propeller fold protein YncE